MALFALCVAAGCADGGTPGVPSDGGVDAATPDGGALPLGDALSVPRDETWRWVPVDGMRCADGSAGGMYTSFSSESDDFVLFLRGGGVCYDLQTCQLDAPMLDGLGPDPLGAWLAEGVATRGIFDRSDATNPLRHASFAVLPHCTGDFHLADRVSTYPPLEPLHQVGYENVRVALTRLVPTFAHASRVVLAGFSAGGVGALGNYDQVASAFAQVGQPPPYLIVDAGPVLREPFLAAASQAKIRAGWGLDETLGPSCPSCAADGYHELVARLRVLHPGVRSALVCAYEDMTVRVLYQLMGSGDYLGDEDRLRDGLRDFATWADRLTPAGSSAQRELFYASTRHGALIVAPLSDTPGLAAFLTAQLDDDPGWASVTP